MLQFGQSPILHDWYIGESQKHLTSSHTIYWVEEDSSEYHRQIQMSKIQEGKLIPDGD